MVEKKQVGTQRSMIGKKRMIFRQIPTSEGTRIALNTANMEK